MPVYNTAIYLRQAIESILNQTYHDFEFLIFNDGSTDDSLAIIQSYPDKRIQLVNSQENKGLIYWLNHGINIARGKLIARMDSDDIAMPDRFEEQVNLLKKCADIDVCGSNIRLIHNNKLSVVVEYPQLSSDIKIEMLFRCALAHPTVMYRKELFAVNQTSYNPDFFAAEDYYLWYQLKDKANFFNIQKVLLHYRVSDNQESYLHKTVQVKNAKDVQQLFFNHLNIAKGDHAEILNGPLERNVTYLMKVGSEMERICAANDLYHVYDPERLKRRLATKFWERCRFACSKNCNGLRVYLQYKFTLSYRLTWWETVKALIKMRLIN